MEIQLKIKNQESGFTELFSILKRYDVKPGGILKLQYDDNEIKIMRQHVTNCTDTLLRGLQELGVLVGFHMQNNPDIIEEVSNIGFFISAIGNLLEALTILRADSDPIIKQ
jgi:hypothetical protein